MNDDRIRELLRELPGAHASPDFTARVMERLDQPARRPTSVGRRLAWAAAAVAVIAAVSVGAWRIEQIRAEAEARAELTALRTETNELADELRRLREQTAAASPVVYLGGDDQIDLVWDFRRSAARGVPAPDQPAARPAAARGR